MLGGGMIDWLIDLCLDDLGIYLALCIFGFWVELTVDAGT